MLTVRSATLGEVERVGTTLAAAFADDPVWAAMASPTADWSARASAWFATDARLQLRGRGEVLVDHDLRGAAVWAPPGHWKPSVRESAGLAVPSLRLFRSRIPTAARMWAVMEKRHPRAPRHWYLALLGTHPAHQGRGVGSALIRAVTDRCDQEGVPAYLESSKEQNVPFYRRHGFEVREVVTLPDGPPSWFMWREPRG